MAESLRLPVYPATCPPEASDGAAPAAVESQRVSRLTAVLLRGTIGIGVGALALIGFLLLVTSRVPGTYPG